MAPRAYDNQTRQQQQLALKERIAAAAAQLHAVQGTLATSYAQVAQQAGVSVPTVYKHFPQLDDLVQGCTAHVAGLGPELPADRVLAAPDLASAARKLVAAMDIQHAYFEPWLQWNEQRQLPALARMQELQRGQLTALCRAVLDRHRSSGPLPEQAAVWETLLQFECWQRLVRQHHLSRASARRALAHLLLAVAGPQPATSSTASGKPRS